MRKHITTALELLGGLLIIAALAAWAASVSIPLALLVGGVGLVGFSAVITKVPAMFADRVARRAKRDYLRAQRREKKAVKA